LPTALRHGGIPESDISPVMAQLTRFPQPAAVYPTPAPAEARGRNTGMWGAGLALWLSAMVPPLVMGPLYAQRESGSERKAIYYTLMVPVLGPFISGIWLPVKTRADFGDYAVREYAIPWIVADGLTQVAGFTLLVLGLQPRPLPPKLSRVLGNVRITPYAAGQTFGVAGLY
jgi:hypothetical protein